VGGIDAMPNPLPDTITVDDLLAALAAFDGGAAHRFADSTGYDLFFEGRRHPPKAVVGIAARAVTGVEYGPERGCVGDCESAATERGIYRVALVCGKRRLHLEPFAVIARHPVDDGC